MKKTRIGIIGGTGGIGKWFARFFEKEGYTVHVSGRNTGMTMPEMAKTCPVVIISVPISATCGIIEKVGPLLDEKSLLMDLTSVKTEPVRSMLLFSKAEVVGMHPLFGPDIDSLSGQNVILCPARTGKWLPWITGILERNLAAVTITTPEKHDAMMAVVQGLNHLNTILMGLTLRNAGVNPSELERFSTPLFRMKSAAVEKIFARNPRLYAEILTSNPNIHKVLDLYEENLSRLKSLIGKNDAEGVAGVITGEGG
ncbi:MAG: prephenate dehydrogenase/arogenate dehydrogenase family protein [Syntrophales bacterium]